MGSIPDQLLTQESPGRYTGAFTVTDDTPGGGFRVIVHLAVPGFPEVVYEGPRVDIIKPAPPPSAPSGSAPAPAEQGLAGVPRWVEWLADVIGWAATFWALVVAAHAFGLDNWLIALALAALLFLFRGQLLNPIQRAVKYIIIEIFKTIIELVEFVITWLRAVAEYFQGNFIRAVLRIIILAAFMWIWNLAQTIPAIKQLLDNIFEVAGKIIKFVNDLFDQILGWIEDLRKRVRDSLDVMLSRLGDLGLAIRGEVLGIVDRLFGGIRGELQELRFKILGEVDLVRKLLGLEVRIMGERFKLIPEEVRKYILTHAGARTAEVIDDFGWALASTGPVPLPPDPRGNAPWDLFDYTVAEIESSRLGNLAPAQVAFNEAIADIDAWRAGKPRPVDPWPPDIWNRISPPAPPSVPGAMPFKPAFIPDVDWNLVTARFGTPLHIAFLIAAIGWHETHWGQLGKGRDGYYLGVGCPNGDCKPEFQGLERQIAWAGPRLQQYFPDAGFTYEDVLRFANEIWKPGDRPAWATSVLSIYDGLVRSRR